jgi:hypothetical protein
VTYHTESLPINTPTRPEVILVGLELRLAKVKPSRQLNLSLEVTFIMDKRLSLEGQTQFEISSPDGRVVQNFSFHLNSSFLSARMNRIPVPITLKPQIRWSLRLCAVMNSGKRFCGFREDIPITVHQPFSILHFYRVELTVAL